MKIKQFLSDYQTQSKPYWQDFLDKWQKKSKLSGKINQILLQKVFDFYPLGKQFRGALSNFSYQIAGGKNQKQMLKASVVVELLQTAFLIADDVFDDDDIRRGQPTIHRQWQDYFSSQNLDYGKSMAVNTSLLIFHLIPILLNELEFDPKLKQEALDFYYHKTIETIWGEVLDISTPFMDFEARKGSSSIIHKYKTVAYTAIWPMMFGVILAGNRDKNFRAKIIDIATIIGQMFQIQDDIIGTFGDSQKIGKASSSDIKQARWTILVELFFQKADKKDAAKLRNIYQQKSIYSSEIEIVKNLFNKYKIKKSAQDQNQTLHKKGLAIIPQITDNKDYQETLIEILDYLVKRER